MKNTKKAKKVTPSHKTTGRLRDRLKVRSHLFDLELQDQWEKLEKDWHLVSSEIKRMLPQAKQAAKRSARAAKPLLEKLHASLNRIQEGLERHHAERKLIMKSMMITSLLLVSAFATETPEYRDGAWVNHQSLPGVPMLKMEVDSSKQKVFLTLNKEKTVPQSVDVTFIGPTGNRTRVELKSMDSSRLPARYEGGLAKMESFVGFEIKIPFSSNSPKVVGSHQLKKEK